MLQPTELLDMLRPHAQLHKLDASLVYGVTLQESGGDPGALRYEAHYRWLVEPERVKPALCSTSTEITLQRMSYGLMQVMGAVFREYGYRGWLSRIPCDPDIQLAYGCRHLAVLFRRYGDQGRDAVISAYNAGHPTTQNSDYVVQVLRYAGSCPC